MNLIDIVRRRTHSKGRLHDGLPNGILNPWPGLAAYTDPANSYVHYMFCGRDKESFELTRMIDDHVFVTLYGKSGNGKTSLLNAGVFPNLRQMQYVPISIRLGTLPLNRSFQESILEAIEKTINPNCLETVWIIPPISDRDANDYLWNYFARQRFYVNDNHSRQVFPVIVLDQFEEVYKQRKNDADILLRQISYLMDQSHEIESKMIDGQVYEYEYNFRFVVSIREDDLFLLEDSIDNNYLEDMKLTRYRLLPISNSGARDVILKPVQKEHLFDDADKDNIVQTIIDIAKGNSDSISSNVLSLICNRIYARYYQQQEGKGTISSDLVEQFVSENPLEKFYLEATRQLNQKQRSYLEDNLVDIAERRGSVAKVNFDSVFGDKAKSLLEGPMKILQESNDRVELIHDSFCRVLLAQKAKRMGHWRTVAEHVALLVVSVISLALGVHVMSFCGQISSEGVFQHFLVYPLYGYPYFIMLLLFDVVGVIRRQIRKRVLDWTALIVLYPVFLDIFVFKETASLSFAYYLIGTVVIALLRAGRWYLGKYGSIQKEQEDGLFSLLNIKSLRIWIFIIIIYALFKYGAFIMTAPYLAIMCFSYLSAVFCSFFDRDGDEDGTWSLVWVLLLPVSFMVYCTSGTEYLTLTISGWFECLLSFGFCWGIFLVLGWMFARDVSEHKWKSILYYLLTLVLIFTFYSIFYKYKFVMLLIWGIMVFGALYFIDGEKIVLPRYALSLAFSLAIYVFMNGYSPLIPGHPVEDQPEDGWWKNVIVANDGGYQLRDAVSVEDLLGQTFDEMKGNDYLVMQIHDGLKLDFPYFTNLIRVDKDSHRLSYKIYPEFEQYIRKQKRLRNDEALVYEDTRNRVFKQLSYYKPVPCSKEQVSRIKYLSRSEEHALADLLSEEDETVIKSKITRVLCKGISCSWLLNSIAESNNPSDEAYLGYLSAYTSFTRSYFAEHLPDYEGYDWDGFFDNMLQMYLAVVQDSKLKPVDDYLKQVLPVMVAYYYVIEDYGNKTLLYGKILRMQQLAIAYGMGDESWAHEQLPPPIDVNIKQYYFQSSLASDQL